MKIVIACDHAGHVYKEPIIKDLKLLGHEVIDVGCDSEASVHYPIYAEKAAKEIQEGRAEKGVLICGTGIGISIAANKCKGIRAALCHDHLTAALCSSHNNANMVAFGARVIGLDVALDIVRTFLNTAFLKGRHLERINMVSDLERRQY